MDEPTKNPQALSKAMLLAALVLSVFALIAAVMIVFTYQNTAERIEQNKHDFILKNLNDVMPVNSYDNDLIADSYFVTDPLLGTGPNQIYPAFKNTQAVGVIITAVAPNGYNGKIKLLVGVNYAGVIHAVRVVEHKETPGLGDPIEIKRSDWITQFEQHSIINPVDANWRVKKDGGDFDQLTGATITPRAVVQAVRNALLYYQAHKDSIYAKVENTAE